MNFPKRPQEDLSNPENLGKFSNNQSRGGPGNEISQKETVHHQEGVSLTKGLYVIFSVDKKGFLKKNLYIIEISAGVLAPDKTSVNNGKLYSLVQSPVNIPPNITELTLISNCDMAGCQ